MFLYSLAVPCLLVLASALLIVLTFRHARGIRVRHGRGLRIVRTAALTLLSLVAVALAFTSGLNSFEGWRYTRSHPPRGSIYTIDGYKMRLDCQGAGAPTLVLDAGLGNDGLIWQVVQPALARSTRVCSYDRAGWGASDSRPGPRDAGHIAAELHALLTRAKIDGPIVLMAHSIAGLYIRDYAAHYPAQVAGLVFIDSSTPLQQDRGSAALRASQNSDGAWSRWTTIASFALGLPRLQGACSQQLPGFSRLESQAVAESLCQPRTGASIRSELDTLRRSGEQTVHTGPFGAIPVLVLSSDPNAPGEPGHPAALTQEHAQLWNQMQEELKGLSTNSRRVIAKGSGHYIQLERTDLVIREVTDFIDTVRRGSVLSGAGATVTR